MDKTMQVQAQIRQNAEGISAALSDMSKWEKQIKTKDKKLTEQGMSGTRAPVRSGAGTVAVKSASSAGGTTSKPGELTPFSIANKVAVPDTSSKPMVPKALGIHIDVDPEEVERERGNLDFKNGNFTSAVKAYTKCLGLKSKNYVAFSNRAMAYLKLKEYSRAVVDCNAALQIEPNHVKSLLRRASAYNSLGKHRAALVDLNRALELEPSSKQARTEVQTTKELLRNAVNRAPLISVPINFGVSSEDNLAVMQGPDPSPPSWVPPPAVAAVESSADITAVSVGPAASESLGPKAESGSKPAASVADSAGSASLAQYYHSNNPVRLPPASSAAPSSSSAAAPTAAAEDAGVTHRIPITLDDDDDDDEGDEIEIKINSSSAAAAHVPDRYIDKYAVMEEPESPPKTVSVAKDKVTPVKEALKKKDAKKTAVAADSGSGSKTKSSKTKSSSSTVKKFTSYDLLRELTNSRMNLQKLSVIFATFKASHVSAVLQGLMEADLLFMLLKAVYVYFSGDGSAEYVAQPQEIVKFYDAISGSSSFSLMYSLLPGDEKSLIGTYLMELQSSAAVQDDELTQAVRRVRQIYGFA